MGWAGAAPAARPPRPTAYALVLAADAADAAARRAVGLRPAVPLPLVLVVVQVANAAKVAAHAEPTALAVLRRARAARRGVREEGTVRAPHLLRYLLRPAAQASHVRHGVAVQRVPLARVCNLCLDRLVVCGGAQLCWEAVIPQNQQKRLTANATRKEAIDKTTLALATWREQLAPAVVVAAPKRRLRGGRWGGCGRSGISGSGVAGGV